MLILRTEKVFYSRGKHLRTIIQKLYRLGPLALLLALLWTMHPSAAGVSHAASSVTWTSQTSTTATPTGHTTGWANVRTGPGTSYAIVTTYAPNTTVNIYASVTGEIVWSRIANWYRISNLSSSPLYIYGGLVAYTPDSGSGSGPAPSPSPQGKEILISIAKQWMYVYENGKAVYNSPITTGQPALPTPTGTYHVFAKLSPTTFYSPWPYGSPYWYPPSHINYALEWREGGYFLHDSWWRSTFGPGTNVWHKDPVYGWLTGTHGCVTMPLKTAAWLYNWAPIGTLVQINP